MEFGGEEMLEFLGNISADGVRLADYPRLVRAFAEAGRRLGEDIVALPGGDFGVLPWTRPMRDVMPRPLSARRWQAG